MSDEVVDLRPWGYAVGNYMLTRGCAACGCDLYQVDKYASRCCQCAEVARDKHIAYLDRVAKPVEKETGLPHPSEAMTTPKGQRVFVVVVTAGDYAEDTDTYIAGVYTDRDIAEAAGGEPGAFVIPVPLNLFGRYWRP